MLHESAYGLQLGATLGLYGTLAPVKQLANSRKSALSTLLLLSRS